MMASIGLTVYTLTVLAWLCTAESQEPLSITTIKHDPYVMAKGNQLDGFCMDLLSELAKRAGFKYNVHLVKDSQFGRLDESGRWTGMVGEVVKGEADLAVAPLTMTALREQVVDMSTPFMMTGLSFLMRKDVAGEEDDFFSFLGPFSSETWVGILGAYVVTAVCVYLATRISPCEWAHPETDQHSFTILHSFWYITGALTLQGAGPHPKALSGRVISAIWWIFTLVLLASYFANFESSLHSDTKHLKIKTFDDLANQDILDYGTIRGGSTFSFFKNSNHTTYRRIYEHMDRSKSTVATLDEGIRRVQEGNYAFIGESVSLDLDVGRYCDLVRSPEVIAMRGYAIAGRLGSPLIKNLSVAILQLSESGELTYLRTKWWPNRCSGKSEQGAGLQPHNLKGLFLLLGLGLTLGFVLALLELASMARNSAKHQKKACCSVLSTELSQRFGTAGPTASPEAADKSKA